MASQTGDDSWKEKLEYEPRSAILKNSLHNITLIMENDPNLKGIVFNQLADGLEIKGEVPWKHPARFWQDADDAQLSASWTLITDRFQNAIIVSRLPR